jgi:hypothetical protein
MKRKKPENVVTRTLRVRIKDKHAGLLRSMAIETNRVWNHVNEMTRDAYLEPIPGFGWVPCGEWLSSYDVNAKLNGYTKTHDVTINMFTVQEISAIHAKARNQFKRSKLRWRASAGSRRNLGWVPFRIGALTYRQGQVSYAGHRFAIWDSYGLSGKTFRAGSFSEDSRGRWYLNVTVDTEITALTATSAVGIDLGLSSIATCSDGAKLDNARFYRQAEPKLAIAQRAGKTNRVRAIHAKIKHQRHDALHKFTTTITKKHALIVVGNLRPSCMTRTKLAKSAYDAGLGALKHMLNYKAIAQSALCMEQNEAYTTQACSCCGERSGPKGRAGLGIRVWSCHACGTTHDRDINAARNILALDYSRLAVEVPVLSA